MLGSYSHGERVLDDIGGLKLRGISRQVEHELIQGITESFVSYAMLGSYTRSTWCSRVVKRPSNIVNEISFVVSCRGVGIRETIVLARFHQRGRAEVTHSVSQWNEELGKAMKGERTPNRRKYSQNIRVTGLALATQYPACINTRALPGLFLCSNIPCYSCVPKVNIFTFRR